MIAVGGGGVVRDMIQRAHNMKLGINLMDGPEGASTDKAAIMPEYAFKGAQGLIKSFMPGIRKSLTEILIRPKSMSMCLRRAGSRDLWPI